MDGTLPRAKGRPSSATTMPRAFKMHGRRPHTRRRICRHSRSELEPSWMPSLPAPCPPPSKRQQAQTSPPWRRQPAFVPRMENFMGLRGPMTIAAVALGTAPTCGITRQPRRFCFPRLRGRCVRRRLDTAWMTRAACVFANCFPMARRDTTLRPPMDRWDRSFTPIWTGSLAEMRSG